MKLKLDGLKTVPIHELDVGAFFAPVRDAATPFVPYVVISGGQQVGGKLALAMAGPQAFKATRLRDSTFHGVKLDIEGAAIDLPPDTSSIAAIHVPGVLVVSEHGTWVRVSWSNSFEDVYSYVSLQTWTLVDEYPHLTGYFDKWRLVGRLSGEEITIAEFTPPPA